LNRRFLGGKSALLCDLSQRPAGQMLQVGILEIDQQYLLWRAR
jgi:hypothetical protein